VATSEGVTDTAILAVSPVPVDSVQVVPDSLEVREGYQKTYTASVFDSTGAELTGRVITWTTADPGVATVDPTTGVVTGVSAGLTTVIATSEGITDGAIVAVTPAPVDSVQVVPDSLEVRVGYQKTYTFAVFDSLGVELTGRTATWSVTDPAVATVDPATGVVTGVSAGVTTVVATSEGVTDAAIVAVTPVPVDSVQVVPDSLEVREGYQTTYTASVFDSTGVELSGREITWSVTDPAVATVDPSTGVVTGVSAGVTTVIATSEGVTDGAIIAVTPPAVDSVQVVPDSLEVREGYQKTYTASVFDSTGAELTGRVITWTTADPAVATVDPATGVVTGVSAGLTTVIATSEGITDGAIVAVTPAPVDSVQVVPDSADVLVGGTVAYTASVFDSTGAELTGRAISWTTADPGVAAVDPATGVVSGVAIGQTTLTATSEGISDDAIVTVSQIPVDSVLVSPDSAEVRIGYTKSFTAETFDAEGGLLVGREITWSSSDPAVATVDPATGVVTGLATGTTTLVATSEGITDAAIISVSPAPVTTVVVSPDSTDLTPGSSSNLTVSVLDSTGAALSGREVTWTIGDPAVATIDAATGTLSAVGLGATTATATSEGVSDDAIVTVTLNGFRVALASDAAGNSDIWLLNPVDGVTLQITADPQDEKDPAWSPDGTQIAYAAPGPQDRFRLQVMDADGANSVSVGASANRSRELPQWSPDGSLIAHAEGTGAARNIAVWSSVDGLVTTLTDSGFEDSDPAWAPDGRIVFFSRRDGDAEIYVMNADGSGQTRLTTVGGDDTAPKFSPDGTRIVFASTRDSGDSEIWVMDADGSNPVRLTTSVGVDTSPVWSPDGTRIYFVSLRDGNAEVYVMDADGGNQARVTTTAANELSPTVR
jgi:Tol biopolymer transport system component